MIHICTSLDFWAAMPFFLAIERQHPAKARICSAIRIFSGQERALRLFCHRACLSSNRWISFFIGEPVLKSLPRFGQAVLRGQTFNFFPAGAARFE